jgi:hypothetical protein
LGEIGRCLVVAVTVAVTVTASMAIVSMDMPSASQARSLERSIFRFDRSVGDS